MPEQPKTTESRSLRIEDYALIGDLHTAALVGRDGSIDWLCLPRFDSPACFASLVGDDNNGRWLIAPAGEVRSAQRRYRDDTLVLETIYETAEGRAAVVDFMPHDGEGDETRLVRIVRGLSGVVKMRAEIVLRFDYGSLVPWVRHMDDGLRADAGPDALTIRTPVQFKGEHFRSEATFSIAEGQITPFVLTAFRSHLPEPDPIDPTRALDATKSWWRDWAAKCTYEGPWRDAVVRSLITLKALAYAPTGGIVAAPTTSLPELIGGARNWDYRFCWVRDATFTLYALLISGYREEAQAWREWLLRAVAGSPAQLQPLYGVAGERRLTEYEAPWLVGYERSAPVRIGNAAAEQTQLDVFGELLDAFHVARAHNLAPSLDAWRVQQVILDFLESRWSEPDRGIWEIRGDPQQLVHSKVLAWAAMDRAVKAVDRFNLEGARDRWANLRDRIHADVCKNGYDSDRNTFVQHYGAKGLDASLLMLPLVGFLPADDPRIVGTAEAIRKELLVDGFVRRYTAGDGADGLAGGEGAFLPCSFWLADNDAMMGRVDEARAMFERLLAVRNDLGLLSEEYDPAARRQLGNFPQAFSHIALINTAHNLTMRRGPSHQRSEA